MKKMLTPKAIEYARKLLILEDTIKTSNIKEDVFKAQEKIQAIVDEVCDMYEPTAMYKIDEQMEILEKGRKNL